MDVFINKFRKKFYGKVNMALWGKQDTVYSTGTITTITDAGVITGNGTTWNSGNGVVPGLVISMGAYGSGVIKSVDSTTQVTLASASGITAGTTLTQAYNMSEQPKYTVEDSNYAASEIYGVDETEVGVAATTAYAVTHAGWVGMTTYIDNHGNLRVKHEVLVAGSSITADADDDAKFAE